MRVAVAHAVVHPLVAAGRQHRHAEDDRIFKNAVHHVAEVLVEGVLRGAPARGDDRGAPGDGSRVGIHRPLAGVGPETDLERRQRSDGSGDGDIAGHFAVRALRVAGGRIGGPVHADHRRSSHGEAQAVEIVVQVLLDEAAGQLDDADGLALAGAGGEAVDGGHLERRERRIGDARRLVVPGQRAVVEAEHALNDRGQVRREEDRSDPTAVGQPGGLPSAEGDAECGVHPGHRAAQHDGPAHQAHLLDAEVVGGREGRHPRRVVRRRAVPRFELGDGEIRVRAGGDGRGRGAGGDAGTGAPPSVRRRSRTLTVSRS